MQELKAIAKNFINLFYPLHCPGCSKQLDPLDDRGLCAHCVASIKPNAMPPFELETPAIMAYSACLYEGTLKELIHGFKYRGRVALSKIFIGIMTDYMKENPELKAAGVVTCVPLHRSRMREREFNQSMSIARGIAKELALSAKDTLEKTKRTNYQNELTKSERLTNLKGAFRVRDNAGIEGKSVLLIDDVMTTGATLNECGAALLSGGADSVTCFTLARGI